MFNVLLALSLGAIVGAIFSHLAMRHRQQRETRDRQHQYETQLAEREQFWQQQLDRELQRSQTLQNALTELRATYRTPECNRSTVQLTSTKQPKIPHGLKGQRQTYIRAYQPWIAEEEAVLKQRYEAGFTVRAIAAELQRQPGAVRSRLRKLGLDRD